jgi:hypothetical protein
MISIDKKILFTASKKTGKNSKEDDVNYTLENELYKKFIEDKKTNSVFSLATLCVNPFKNLLKILKEAFEYITLEVRPDGIRIDSFKYFGKKKAHDIIGLIYFIGTCGFGDNIPFIKWDRCEEYECKVDSIFVSLKTSDLDIVIEHITNDVILYMFVNKTNYNTESKESSNIEFHIREEKYKLRGCKEFGYTNIIVPFTKNMSDDNVVISDDE